MPHRVALIALLLAVVAPAINAREAIAAAEEKTVRVVYLVPSDRREREDYKKAIAETMREIQLWYACNLNGKTFRLNEPMIEVRSVKHTADWYNEHAVAGVTDQKLFTWYNAYQAAADAIGAKTDDPDYVWMIYIDAPGGTGAGTTGVAVLVQHDLEGLLRKHNIGGSAHELGHAFGLPHPGDNFADALMQTGYIKYPQCYLTRQDERTLLRSVFINNGAGLDFQGNHCFIYDGGYFRRIAGERWYEYKTETPQVIDFTLRRQDDDFYFMSRPQGDGFIWIALPKKGHGTQIKLAGQDSDYTKLYEIRK